MKREIELIARRLDVFCRDVLAPSVYADAHALDVGVWQCAEPVAFADARSQAFTPVATGWRWGPSWSTCWFRLRGSVPASLAGRPLVLRFSSGTEALWWDAAAGPMQGFDVNRDTAFLFGSTKGDHAVPASAAAGTPVECYIEAACNHPFGISCFEWDPADHHKRWKSSTPGELERAEIAAMDQAAWALHRAFAFGVELLKQLPPDTERARHLAAGLLAAVREIDDADPRAGAPRALETVHALLRSPISGSTSRAVAVGHAHIDTAWLWPLRETRRKCLRTFSNVVSLMERFPGFKFFCSQAQQYAYVEEDSPELFARIKARVLSGDWEPGGAMWVEPDANCPSGESLLRQCLHGARYWSDRFGDAAPQRILYLPDTFGFPACLPGIMAHAGLDTFITNKMWWSQFNEFPHTSFRWRGVDGSEVLAHNTPGGDYNALLTPRELRKGDDRAQRTGGRGLYLQPFGFGDGGGGPTDWTIAYGGFAEECDGVPAVSFARADEFCDMLHQLRDSHREAGDDLPLWQGELYLEIHRGTLTSQARVKQHNRRCEELLRLAEILTFAGPAAPEPDKAAAAVARLDQAWKKLLLNQFHDILPGSSIGWVYKDAEADYTLIRRTATQLIEKGLKQWHAALDTRGIIRPLAVLNPGSTPRSGVVAFDGPDGTELKFVRDVPALGVKVAELHSSSGCVPVVLRQSEAGVSLSNGVIDVTLDDCGRVLELARAGAARDICRAHAAPDDPESVVVVPLNQLVMYEDRPHMWDAWDIDPGYEHKPVWSNDEPAAMTITSEHPLRAEVRFTRTTAAGSVIEQVFRLDAGSPRLDVMTRVDWKEKHRILRALFPADISCRTASYDIQFGVVERPTHTNTSWDAAQMENCAHRWVDASEQGLGLAVLSDSRYGWSCRADDDDAGVVLGLSLLRSPTHPDPDADTGEHLFTYSLMPHDGDWRAAGVDREAEALNMPLSGTLLRPEQHGTSASHAPLSVTTDAPCGVLVHAVKPAEDDTRAWIVRLSECRGARGRAVLRFARPIASVTPVDAIERENQPHIDTDATTANGEVVLNLRPFEIVSLKVRPA